MRRFHAGEHSRTVFIPAAMLFAAILLLLSCGDDPFSPILPDFNLVSIVFTGDSTGGGNVRSKITAQPQRQQETDKGDPFCQVTVTWSPPEDENVLSYSLFRSIEPNVSSDDIIVTTTADTVAIDSDSLQWGTTYYYAVRAVRSDSTTLWSDEGNITTPLSQLPTPSVLSAIPLPMGKCMLNWTQCPDDDFFSYTLVRSQFAWMSNCDTLGVFLSDQDTLFVDSIVPLYMPRFYQVTTSDTQDISVQSNMLEYVDGYGLPWFIDIIWQGPRDIGSYWIREETLAHSWHEDYIYFIERNEIPYPPYTAYQYIRRLNASSGGAVNEGLCGTDVPCPMFTHSPEENALLVSVPNPDYSSELLLLAEYSLGTITSIHIDVRLNGLLAIPQSGLALLSLYGSSSTLVLDISSMQFVDTLDYAFAHGKVFDGLGVYIWGGGGPLRRVDPISLEITASKPTIPLCKGMLAADNGDLCFFNSSVAYRCDPYDLSTLSTYVLPYYEKATLVDAQGSLFAYLYSSSSRSISVYDLENSQYLGDVIGDPDIELFEVFDMLTLPGENAVWCTGGVINDYYYGAFSISR